VIVIVPDAREAGSSVGLIVTLSSPSGQPPAVQVMPEPAALPAGGSTIRKLSDGVADHDSSPLPGFAIRIVALAWSGVPFTWMLIVPPSTLSRGVPSSRLWMLLASVGTAARCAGWGVGMSISE